LSVLLEALKKAAEDKKKALENSEQSNKVEVSLVQEDRAEKNMTPEPSVESEALDHSAEIKLSLNESVTLAPAESIKKPKIKKTSPLPPVSKESPEVALKLDLSLDVPQKTEKTLEPLNAASERGDKAMPQASLKLVIEESTEQSEPLLDNSLNKEAATLKTAQDITESVPPLDESTRLNMALPDEPPVEKTIDSLKEESIESNYSSENIKENETTDLHLAKNGLDGVTVTPAFAKSTAESLKRESLEESQGSSENKEVAVSNTESLKTVLDMEEKIENSVSEQEQIPDHLLEDSAKSPSIQRDKVSLKEDEDSYKWSLDALPGYLGLGKKKKLKKNSAEGSNPILVAGALSENPARPMKKASIKLVLILLVLLLFIGIIFYGFLYYQEQNDALEQRMKKYNLVKTHIAVKELPNAISEQSENRTETPEIISKEEGLSQTPLNDGVHEMVSIEEAQKVPLAKSENAVSLGQNKQYQKNIEKPVAESVTSKIEAVVRAPEKKVNSQIVNAPKISVKVLDNTPNKAIIEVHSEEDVLSEAYLSYELGEFSRAQQAFEAVLTMNPNNEFALIGLGNILASKQQYIAAMDYYQKAFAAQPSSLNAFEAMANISGHIELNSDWKNVLSEMAQDHSESATLQYALGNLYAEENDWLAAQSAYFQAVALEPDNADYLVNLAVSLDQLGKYNLAARYYTEALAFADVERVNFNEAQVKNRLISIRQFMAGRVQ